MPIIENAEGPIANPDTVFLPTYAAMLYPRDEKARRRWCAAAMARQYSLCRESGTPSALLSDFHTWIPDLWGLKLSPERTYQDGLDRVKRASLSGFSLRFFLALARHHPKRCKLECVKVLLASYPGHEAAVSESLVEKSWAGFQSVSHLWLSLIDMQEAPASVVQWLQFLKRAEAYRRAAEHARLLDSTETWKPEAHYLFRDEVEIGPLDRAKLAVLDRYFPDE
jgi:hypothetical protein